MNFCKSVIKGIFCGIMPVLVLAGCHNTQSSETISTADPANPKVVSEAIVDTKHIELKKLSVRGPTIKIYKITVRPKLNSPIKHDWELSETAYHNCWHGNVVKSYDNGVVLCFDKEGSSAVSDGGK